MRLYHLVFFSIFICFCFGFLNTTAFGDGDGYGFRDDELKYLKERGASPDSYEKSRKLKELFPQLSAEEIIKIKLSGISFQKIIKNKTINPDKGIKEIVPNLDEILAKEVQEIIISIGSSFFKDSYGHSHYETKISFPESFDRGKDILFSQSKFDEDGFSYPDIGIGPLYPSVFDREKLYLLRIYKDEKVIPLDLDMTIKIKNYILHGGKYSYLGEDDEGIKNFFTCHQFVEMILPRSLKNKIAGEKDTLYNLNCSPVICPNKLSPGDGVFMYSSNLLGDGFLSTHSAIYLGYDEKEEESFYLSKLGRASLFVSKGSTLKEIYGRKGLIWKLNKYNELLMKRIKKKEQGTQEEK